MGADGDPTSAKVALAGQRGVAREEEAGGWSRWEAPATSVVETVPVRGGAAGAAAGAAVVWSGGDEQGVEGVEAVVREAGVGVRSRTSEQATSTASHLCLHCQSMAVQVNTRRCADVT